MLELIKSNLVFGGLHQQYRHVSTSVNTSMRFAIFLPPQATNKNRVPVFYWLSGLTCTDENFMQKAGAQRLAAKLGIAIVCPDTSPRGPDVPDDPQQAYDLGLGAGFYVNATQAPWHTHFHMYDYVVHELPLLIEQHFPVSTKRVLSGHSMGGHGALVIALRNPSRYLSVSAFSPICNPSHCPWGIKAFQHYLGNDKSLWTRYDASELLAHHQHAVPALVDVGLADEFLQQQLRPETLLLAANKTHYPLTFNQHQGYDHSYYFIASFIESHLYFHAHHLGITP